MRPRTLVALAVLATLATGLAVSAQVGPQSAAERAEAIKDIATLRGELKTLGSRQAHSGREVEEAKARLQVLNVRETTLSASLGANRNKLAQLLGALQLFRRDPPPALLVSPGDARDAVRAAILIRAMTPELERRAKVYGDEAREIATLRRKAAAASGDVIAAQSEVADRRSDMDRLLTQQAAIERKYPGQAAAAGREAGSPGVLIDSFPRATGPDNGPGPLRYPVTGTVITRYGAKGTGVQPAVGETIRTKPGAAVVSPAQGTVEFAGPVTGWGVILILRTTGAYHLVLGGMDQVAAAPGQKIAAGAPIGRMGGTGAPELYLELRRDGDPIDPGRWLSASP